MTTIKFLLILIVLSSITKAPTIEYPCDTKIKAVFFHKGKKVHTDLNYSFTHVLPHEINLECDLHKKKPKKMLIDKIRFTLVTTEPTITFDTSFTIYGRSFDTVSNYHDSIKQLKGF
jgi:hypothetical protein